MDYIFLYIEIPLNLISMTKNLTLFVFLAIIACKKTRYLFDYHHSTNRRQRQHFRRNV